MHTTSCLRQGVTASRLLTNAHYDVLKAAALKEHGEYPKKHFKMAQLDQPAGIHVLIIEQDEE